MMDLHQEMALKLDPNAKRSGSNWQCRCPSHDDKTPSLSIGIRNQKLVYKCHAGCSFDELANAIRNRGYNPFTAGPDDGWRPGDKHTGQPKRRPVINTVDEDAIFHSKFTYAPTTNPNWHNHPGARRLAPYGYGTTTYNYRSKHGHMAMIVHRHQKTDPTIEGRNKTFEPVSPWMNNETGKLHYIARACPYPVPPYGTETLKRRGVVWVVEGEKCRDAMDKFLRFTYPVISTYGSSPSVSDLSELLERYTIIVPDFDMAGQHYGTEMRTRLGKYSIVMPSIWRGPPNTSAPKTWDIADDINNKEAPIHGKFGALTHDEFLRHMTRYGESLDYENPHNQQILSDAIEQILEINLNP
jgi:hypothetical protein